jgi:lysophospholipase
MLGHTPPYLALLLLGILTHQVKAQGSPKDYAPQMNIKCPDVSKTPLIREFTPQNQVLNENEAAYVAEREKSVIPDAWKDWVGDGSAIGYKLEDFKGNYSRIGIAVSGGGYRAAQYGAGVLSGLDGRDDAAKKAGTGGLLQVTTYMSALSGELLFRTMAFDLTKLMVGGSWLTGSLFMNNWPTIPDMVNGNGNDLSGWLLDLDLAIPDGVNLFNDKNQHFFGSLLWSVEAKAYAGM